MVTWVVWARVKHRRQGKRWQFRDDGVIGPPVWPSREKTPFERFWEHLLSPEKGAANFLAGIGHTTYGNHGQSGALIGYVSQLGALFALLSFSISLIALSCPFAKLPCLL